MKDLSLCSARASGNSVRDASGTLDERVQLSGRCGRSHCLPVPRLQQVAKPNEILEELGAVREQWAVAAGQGIYMAVSQSLACGASSSVAYRRPGREIQPRS